MSPYEIIGVAAISIGGGLLGAILHDRYLEEQPEIPRVAVFDSGAFVMERMLQSNSTGPDRGGRQAVMDAATVADTLAGQGFIVLDKTAVIAAPDVYFVATGPKKAADGSSDEEAVGD